MIESTSTLKIRSLVMMESSFTRLPTVTLDGTEVFEGNLELHAGEGLEKDQVFSDLVVYSRVRYKEEIQAEARVRMIGLFDTTDSTPEMKKGYAFVNCPAIIFPFIREHIASLFLKSGLKPFMLDPVNFVQLAQENQSLQKVETPT